MKQQLASACGPQPVKNSKLHVLSWESRLKPAGSPWYKQLSLASIFLPNRDLAS